MKCVGVLHSLTAGLELPLWDCVFVQEEDGAEGSCVQVLLLPRLV